MLSIKKAAFGLSNQYPVAPSRPGERAQRRIEMSELEKAKKLLRLPEMTTTHDVMVALAEADAPRRAPFIKAEEIGLDIGKLANDAGYRFELGEQYGPCRTV
jgi:hypothetical protein